MKHFENIYYAYGKYSLKDICPIQYGEELCNPGHSFGPFVRRNYLLHYIYSGKGTFKANNKEYHLHSGQMFLICPNQLTYYKADDNEPWLYRWIEFNGSIAESVLKSGGLDINSPIFSDNKNHSVGNAMYDITKLDEAQFENIMQKLWALVNCISHSQQTHIITDSEEYIKKAELFIKTNLHKKISVSEIAKYVGIDRSYLSRLFNVYLGTSPQNYIISLKMTAASKYLTSTSMSIKEVSQSVGYFDTHIFNKNFKNKFGMSPSDWRKQN